MLIPKARIAQLEAELAGVKIENAAPKEMVRPKSSRLGEPLEQAESRIRREIEEGLRVLPEGNTDLPQHIQELLRIRKKISKENREKTRSSR